MAPPFAQTEPVSSPGASATFGLPAGTSLVSLASLRVLPRAAAIMQDTCCCYASLWWLSYRRNKLATDDKTVINLCISPNQVEKQNQKRNA